MRAAHSSGGSLTVSPSPARASVRAGRRPTRRAAGPRADRYGTRAQRPVGSGGANESEAEAASTDARRRQNTHSERASAKERYSAASCRASGEDERPPAARRRARDGAARSEAGGQAAARRCSMSRGRCRARRQGSAAGASFVELEWTREQEAGWRDTVGAGASESATRLYA